jgi:hypothetical protein
MVVDLICSEDRCTIHDVEMVVDDEGGKRPSGRNPWRGFCLRIDALDRIKREQVERMLVDHYSSRSQFEEIPVDAIKTIVQDELKKHQNVSFSSRQNKRKSGGTPL